jgi:hypothetical protein
MSIACASGWRPCWCCGLSGGWMVQAVDVSP